MTDTRRRVKLYALNSERQWDDKGTGHVSSTYVERLKGISLLVRAESDGSLLLESKIQNDTAYQKQQETLIVWSEGDNFDLALSFQEKAGCDEIWEKICQVQGKDPSVEFTQELVEESEDERCFDEMSDSVSASHPIDLPNPELSSLEDISLLVSSCLPSPVRREKLALSIESESYIPKLLSLFRTCESSEDMRGLHHLFDIFKNIFLLNKNSLFELLFAEETIFDVVGCLEFDPNLQVRKPHRQYLKSVATFHKVINISNSDLLSKIHQTYRVQYIQDVVLPPPSVFEENMLSTLSSFIFFNKVEIVCLIQEDESFLTQLFSLLQGSRPQRHDEQQEQKTKDDSSSEEKNERRIRDAVCFLKEFCSFSQTLQPASRESFFKTLNSLGVLSSLELTLSSKNLSTKAASIDILLYIVEFSPSLVREYMQQQQMAEHGNRVEGSGAENSKSLLMNIIIKEMNSDSDPDMNGAVQLLGIIRTLLDPENMLASVNKSEKTDFLHYFYKNCMSILLEPLLQSTKSRSTRKRLSKSVVFPPPSSSTKESVEFILQDALVKIKGEESEEEQEEEQENPFPSPSVVKTQQLQQNNQDGSTVQLLSLILELLSFCVEHHTYHIKNYILNKDLLSKILRLLSSRHTFLVLCALRLLRKILSLKDEFYNRYIIKGNLFAPVISCYLNNKGRYNLLDSAILEMFEFIKLEDIKSLCSHIVENYYSQMSFESITYVNTFKSLKARYDQQMERVNKQQGSGGCILSSRASRFSRDPRNMEEDEEAWFNNEEEDDEEEDEMREESERELPETSELASSEKGKERPEQCSLKQVICPELERKKSLNGSNTDISPTPNSSPNNAKKGLVDYDSDEDSDEELPANCPAKRPRNS